MKVFASILVALSIGCAGGDDLNDPPETSTRVMSPAGGKTDDGASNTTSEIDACEVHELYNDGYCDPYCAEPDPDCEGSERAPDSESETDACAEEERYDDGVCDTDCRVFDEDCAAEEDICLSEYRYGDGTCDEDCDWVDTDCADEVDLSVLEDWERSACSGFRSVGGVPVQELARSLCIEREDQALVDCIGACVAAR